MNTILRSLWAVEYLFNGEARRLNLLADQDASIQEVMNSAEDEIFALEAEDDDPAEILSVAFECEVSVPPLVAEGIASEYEAIDGEDLEEDVEVPDETDVPVEGTEQPAL